MNSSQELLMWTAVLAPLVGFITTWLVSPRMPRVIARTPIIAMTVSFLAGCLLIYEIWQSEPVALSFPWFEVGTQSIALDIVIDNRSLVMLVVVSFISLMVHVYSKAYMAEVRGRQKYFALLGFFTFSMQGIVISDSLLLLFFFWELVGFSSYLLIGHETERRTAGAAATKAFVLNRIGDAGFVVGLMILWTIHGTFALSDILATPHPSAWQTAASLCLFCGVIGKSAQFPLFTWLPDAMEGPTPVSALIHAATMVAAGVYLMIKTFGLFTETALVVVAVTGMITALTGALAALSQYDIKKILAYSTMSQLGLMILALGMGVVDAAFLHLVTHAFFKGCLFLSAGLVIHSIRQAASSDVRFDVQDIRNMGGLKSRMPTAFLTFLLSGASLSGIPFFSGFLSKEAMLTAIFTHTNVLSWFMIAFVLTVSFLTVLYTFRLIWFVFFGEAGAVRTLDLREPAFVMRLPTLILAVCSLWLVVSWHPFDFRGWMPGRDPGTEYGLWITIISVLWAGAALYIAWRISFRNRWPSPTVFRNAFYIDQVYAIGTGILLKANAYSTNFVERKVIDRSLHATVYFQVILAHVAGWFDRYAVDGIVNSAARITGSLGKATRSIQGGNIQLYIFSAMFAIIIFIICALN